MLKKYVPEMWQWILGIVLLASLVAWQSGQQIQVIVYKNLLLCNAVVIAHWVDNTFFADKSDSVNEIARAIVFLGVVHGLTQGL